MTTTQGTEFGRTFNTARSEQGFRSQAHLDAFYAHLDHTHTCPTCTGPAVAYWNEADASWQPAGAECAEEQALARASW